MTTQRPATNRIPRLSALGTIRPSSQRSRQDRGPAWTPRTGVLFLVVLLCTAFVGTGPATALTAGSAPGAPATGPAAAPAAPAAGRAAPARLTSAADHAKVVAEEQVAPRQVDLTISSPALATTAKVRLLTPTGWEHRRPGQRWPVLYLLHGCCGDYTSWTSRTDVASIPSLHDVLVVMPEAGNTGWYSDWWNYGQGGAPAWETFHLTEVRSILEHGYGAGDKRVVAGLSMGGFGAMVYAARHPGMFRAAASYSGVVDNRYTPDASETILGFVRRYDLDPLALWGDSGAQADIWAAHNPVDLAPRLRDIPLFLSSGNGENGPLDPPGVSGGIEVLIHQENLLFAQRLHDVGARHVVTDFYGPGTHAWAYWERELHRSLPMLLAALR
ncbi:MAG TPA: alpha/beta hydrolase family protein [Actinopolymorphaceae bacterium]|nr:alpha/beta hydrolase family protein [Actinopolymorphaceae bacterium]